MTRSFPSREMPRTPPEFRLAMRRLVSGKRIVLKVNGETTVDYTEPEKPERPEGRERRVLSHGPIALQAHDPNSTVFYRSIKIKVLPD